MDDFEQVLAILRLRSRKAVIADLRMVLDHVDDMELEEVCRRTLNKLMKISDEEYDALHLGEDEEYVYEEE